MTSHGALSMDRKVGIDWIVMNLESDPGWKCSHGL